jgi:outer membrane lipoprotein-sorting protein
MKRIISLLMVVVVVLFCIGFVACGGGEGDGTAPPANGETTPADGGNGETTTPPEGTTTPPEETTPPPEETLMDILGRGAAITAVEYDAVVTAPGADTVTMHIWFEQGNIRTEITESGETVVLIANFSTQVAYLYSPALGFAYEMDFEQAAELPIPDAQSVPDYEYEILGTEILDGKECLVVEYTAEQATVKMWIWKEHGFPIRAEMTTSSGTTIAEATNLEFGDIPDSRFELPAGVQIMG